MTHLLKTRLETFPRNQRGEKEKLHGTATGKLFCFGFFFCFYIYLYLFIFYSCFTERPSWNTFTDVREWQCGSSFPARQQLEVRGLIGPSCIDGNCSDIYCTHTVPCTALETKAPQSGSNPPRGPQLSLHKTSIFFFLIDPLKCRLGSH